jgi:hypothetical protein
MNKISRFLFGFWLVAPGLVFLAGVNSPSVPQFIGIIGIPAALLMMSEKNVKNAYQDVGITLTCFYALLTGILSFIPGASPAWAYVAAGLSIFAGIVEGIEYLPKIKTELKDHIEHYCLILWLIFFPLLNVFHIGFSASYTTLMLIGAAAGLLVILKMDTGKVPDLPGPIEVGTMKRR